ncbi:MAG: dipeptidase [Pseudomonadota bacterium]
MTPIFDGHNDQLSRLLANPATAPATFAQSPDAAIDARRAALGGFAGGLFAIWIPSPDAAVDDYAAMANARFDVPLPDPVPLTAALPLAQRQFAILLSLERAGHVRVCKTVADIRAAIAAGQIAAVAHMEGAEAIDQDLDALEVFYAAGLRSLGPVWSRPNIFGHGVPFRFPSPPDTGPGLTEAGKRLIKRCAARKMVVDVSHLTEAGFWDVAALTDGPFVASHSNAHALCPTARNLTDRQLDAMAERGCLVGINFATAFLRADGRMLPQVPLTAILDHAEHLMARLGEDHVALGSDYDGAIVPSAIASVEHLQRLPDAMAARGYGVELIAKLCRENWLHTLEAVWGE